MCVCICMCVWVGWREGWGCEGREEDSDRTCKKQNQAGIEAGRQQSLFWPPKENTLFLEQGKARG